MSQNDHAARLREMADIENNGELIFAAVGDEDGAAYSRWAKAAMLAGAEALERVAMLERELAETIERLSNATDFCLGQIPRLPKHWSNKVTVSLRSDSTTPIWAVVWNGNCLAKDGTWEYEPSPSRRDEAFLSRCRFSSLDEAWSAAQAAMEGTDGSAA